MFLMHPATKNKLIEPFTNLNETVYQFLVNNCFAQFGISELSLDSIFDVSDALKIYRSLYVGYKIREMVDIINFCFDKLGECLKDFPDIKLDYKDKDYFLPQLKNIQVFDKSAVLRIATVGDDFL